MDRRRILLIASHAARFSVRGGVGLVFLLLSISFGLLVAHNLMRPVEQMTRNEIERSLDTPPEVIQARVLKSLTTRAKPVVEWMLSSDDSELAADDEEGEARDTRRARRQPSTDLAARDWTKYLLLDRPGMLSAIFLILLLGWPLVASLGAFDLYAGDIGSRQLRYQLLRADRSSIYFGRLLGSVLTFVVVLVLLGATITIYMAVKLPVYGVGPLLAWGAYGTAALLCVSLPYVALSAWISASVSSGMVSLTLTSLVIGGVPLLAMLARLSHPAGDYLQYLLPWGFQTRLLHHETWQVLAALGGLAVQATLFTWLGHRAFTRRDL